MSNFSKIVIIILLLLSFLFIKEKYGEKISHYTKAIKPPVSLELPKLSSNEEGERVKAPTEEGNSGKQEETSKATAEIYFLALNKESNGIYKPVTREVPSEEEKIEYAVKELLKGPNPIEKTMGIYSEIPSGTKLLNIKKKGNKIIIDLSSAFQYGGGTDSIYSRMMQLIKTSIKNSKNKKIYLYIEGKQVNFLGGEGIMITQPLNEKSLEI